MNVMTKPRVPNVSRGYRSLRAEQRRPVAPAQDRLLERLSREIARRRWFLAETYPQQELLTVRLLLDQGLAAFVPMAVTTRRPHRAARHARVSVQYPALPGYVLVGVDADGTGWGFLGQCHTVRGMVCRLEADPATGEKIARPAPLRTRDKDGAPLPEDRCPVHWMVRLSSDKAAVDRFAAMEAQISVGDVVERDLGWCADWRAQVVSIEGRTARLVGEFLGAERHVTADVFDLRRIE